MNHVKTVDWGNSKPEMPKTTKSQEETRKESLQLSEGVRPCQHLIFGLQSFRNCVSQWLQVILTYPVCNILLKQLQETNTLFNCIYKTTRWDRGNFSLSYFTDLETEAQKGKDWTKSHVSVVRSPGRKLLRKVDSGI